jgi:hypothetical protein
MYIVLRFFVLSVGLFFTGCGQVLAEERAGLDLFSLGEMVYSAGSESCLTCHGTDGRGTKRSQVNLRKPATWKAFQIEAALRGSPNEIESEAVVKAVIALGGKGWNEQNFGRLKSHLKEALDNGQGIIAAPQPFDEDMVGLDGPNKKVLSVRVMRMMRKAGLPRASAREIEDTLAAAAFTYIKQAFIQEE